MKLPPPLLAEALEGLVAGAMDAAQQAHTVPAPRSRVPGLAPALPRLPGGGGDGGGALVVKVLEVMVVKVVVLMGMVVVEDLQ